MRWIKSSCVCVSALLASAASATTVTTGTSYFNGTTSLVMAGVIGPAPGYSRNFTMQILDGPLPEWTFTDEVSYSLFVDDDFQSSIDLSDCRTETNYCGFALGDGGYSISGTLSTPLEYTTSFGGIVDTGPQSLQFFLVYPTDGPVDFRLTVFDAVPSGTPEPATWAMMIAGFGACGIALRRARRSGSGRNKKGGDRSPPGWVSNVA